MYCFQKAYHELFSVNVPLYQVNYFEFRLYDNIRALSPYRFIIFISPEIDLMINWGSCFSGALLPVRPK